MPDSSCFCRGLCDKISADEISSSEQISFGEQISSGELMGKLLRNLILILKPEPEWMEDK